MREQLAALEREEQRVRAQVCMLKNKEDKKRGGGSVCLVKLLGGEKEGL